MTTLNDPFFTDKRFFGPNGEPWDLTEWGELFRSADKIIRKTKIGEGMAEVSTVWMGIHSPFHGSILEGADPKCLIYESMVFSEALPDLNLHYEVTSPGLELQLHAYRLREVLVALGVDDDAALPLAAWATEVDAGLLLCTIPEGKLMDWQPLDRDELARMVAEQNERDNFSIEALREERDKAQK